MYSIVTVLFLMAMGSSSWMINNNTFLLVNIIKYTYLSIASNLIVMCCQRCFFSMAVQISLCSIKQKKEITNNCTKEVYIFNDVSERSWKRISHEFCHKKISILKVLGIDKFHSSSILVPSCRWQKLKLF